MNSRFLIVEDVRGYDTIINLDKVAYINPTKKTVVLDCAGGKNDGLVYLSKLGIDTLVNRVYADIARSHDEQR